MKNRIKRIIHGLIFALVWVALLTGLSALFFLGLKEGGAITTEWSGGEYSYFYWWCIFAPISFCVCFIFEAVKHWMPKKKDGGGDKK